MSLHLTEALESIVQTAATVDTFQIGYSNKGTRYVTTPQGTCISWPIYPLNLLFVITRPTILASS